MINFSINGVSYKIREGMTWGEWVNSRYNDTELTIIQHWQAGKIIGVTESYCLGGAYNWVHPTDLIQASNYQLVHEVAEPT